MQAPLLQVLVRLVTAHSLFFSTPVSYSVPFGTSRVSGGIGSVTGLDQPPLRLFDTYQNAFYRVVEVCLTQMNAKALSANLQEVI